MVKPVAETPKKFETKRRRSLCFKKRKSSIKTRQCFCSLDLVQIARNDSYKTLMKNDILCDITLESKDGKLFRAHQIILLQLGSYFRVLMRKKRSDGTLMLDFQGNNIQKMLDFAYSAKFEITLDSLEELIQLASHYKIKWMLAIISTYIREKLKTPNALKLYSVVSNYLCPDLISHIKLFIVKNFTFIKDQEDGFQFCGIDDLGKFFEDDELDMSEEELFMIVEKWVASSNEEEAESLAALIQHVRFNQMTSNFIKNRVLVSDLMNYRRSSKLIETLHKYILKLEGSQNVKWSTISTFFPQQSRIPNEVVFAVGGWTNVPNGPFSCIEIFDFRASKWTELEFILTSPRAYHALALVDHKLFVIGGCNRSNGGIYYNTMECFNLVNCIWTMKMPMNDARCYVSSVTYKGLIYAIGGFNGRNRLRSVECYNPKSGMWTNLQPMLEIRSDADAVAYNGHIYVVGGFDGNNIHNSTEIYDISTNSWRYGPNLNIRRSGVSAIVHEGFMYVLGGYNGMQRLSSVERMDLKKKDIAGSWHFISDMNLQRSNFAAETVNNKILVAGGFEGQSVTENTEIFCPRTGKWELNPPMNTKRSALSVKTVRNLPNIFKYIKKKY